MPRERTPEDVPFLDRIKRLAKGKGEDVELPNDSGKKDPRLKTTADSVMEGFNSVRGLMKAAGRKR